MTKVKIGVLGVSGHLLTRMMLPFTQSKSVEVIAVASRNLEKAEKAAKEWDIPKAYGSYEAILEDPEIEAIYIPLPNHMHLEWVKKSIDAGKHVLCEKPLTLTAEETKTLMTYAKGKDVKVMEAFMYRFHPKWQMVRELMKVSGIGEVHAIHTIFTYNNNDPKNIRNIKEYGGGSLMDIGCYAISSARWIMNKEPQKVMGMIHYSDATGTDVLSSGMLDFGKARALFTVGTGSYPAQEVKVYGSNGTLEVVIPFNDPYDISAQVKVVNALGERVVEFTPTNQYGELFENFAKAITEDTEVPVSLQDSYMNMRIIDQLFESGRTGQWETI
ncbi:Gfo/Idh/MocA family protein [Cellulosilyticum sp. I15G10I2]|uniref:Gfo/Idh/MocA family protein n=1 Tax=Cellulosilyticum sp. I15G10I2 TaxID=1892843 RepID=UPI00085BE081|nr:Gfo/Idh/MocA family oxidoreductase [Cellulosilyticum sp. I15G10I2]